MQNYPIEWYDSFTDTNERKIFTEQEHKIPGLRMIGYHNTSRAIAPLNLHYHKDCFEIHYLLQGNLCFSVENRIYSLSGGDLFILSQSDPLHGRYAHVASRNVLDADKGK